MDPVEKEAIALHRRLRGKIEVRGRLPISSQKDLTLVYTPGVAAVSREISEDREKVYDYTSKWNNVAIITDGSRVLGLGNIGPEAALPVMEGKAMIFKRFGNINAFPICLATSDKEEIIKVVEQISPIFGAINIEDIESPKSLQIVDVLQKKLPIPVFHDDQHGTATVVLAALFNALKVVNKKIEDVRVIIMGAGAAGYGIANMLSKVEFRDILAVDSKGVISSERSETMNEYKQKLASITNRDNETGSLSDAIRGADVTIGVTGKGDLITGEMIRTMKKDPIVFALSNPYPEIMPDAAKKNGTRVMATGRSDFPNQVNNSLIFPFILRAALDERIGSIEEYMLINVARELAKLVGKKLSARHILPSIADKRVLPAIRKAMAMQ